VKINDISNNSDDQWYNKHKIEIVGCGNESIQHSIHDLSFFSMDIGNDNYANTILWAITELGVMAYSVSYNGLKYELLPQSASSTYCSFFLSDLSFDRFSKIRVDKKNNAWVISKEGVRVLGLEEPWTTKFLLDSQTTNLLSNNIYDIAFDDNGYIYFATDKGISIFRGIFAENKSPSSISVSPNPFMIGGDDFLTISNFPSGSIIHIMNLSGKVVKKFTLNEGNVILDWNGKGDDGNYLNTGIYLVSGFHSSQKQGVTKLAIIRK